MGNEIEPRRLALRYEPPAIVVEYARKQSYRTQLYHHEIDLQKQLPALSTAPLKDWVLQEIVDGIISQHGSVLGDVSPQQLKRLVQKLVSHEPQHATSKSRDASPPVATTVAPPPLPQADYNRVSDTQLRQVKDKMDTVFQKNIVKPGDSGYQYDRQVSFVPTEEASDWDD